MLPYLGLDWEMCKCLSNSRVKERKRRIKDFMFCLDLTSWAEAVYPDVSYCSPLTVDSEVPCACPGPDVRWSHLQLWDASPWLRCLKPDCHLGREEDLVVTVSPFQEGSRAVFVFGNFKLEGSERIRNVSLDSCSQIFEETRRIWGLVQLLDVSQNLKNSWWG